MSRAVTPAAAIATAAVVLGLADLPYGYYMLLRFLLCGISLFLLLGARLSLSDWQRWTLGAFAVLYNPLIPIYLGEKEIWTVLNIATAVLFWVVRAQQPRLAVSDPSAPSPATPITDYDAPSATADQLQEQERLIERNDKLTRWQDRAYRK
jgi:hypothetical protein